MRKSDVILVAEDDPHDAFLLQRAFLKAGVTQPVRFVSDGQQAIDYLRGTPPFHDPARYPFPVLLILDLKLPRLSGLEVLTWLCRQPHLNRLPTVVLSGSQDPEDIEHAYAFGADYCMLKPPGHGQLVEAVLHLKRHWLDFPEAMRMPPRSTSQAFLASRL